jgi:subtilisin family serine protease
VAEGACRAWQAVRIVNRSPRALLTFAVIAGVSLTVIPAAGATPPRPGSRHAVAPARHATAATPSYRTDRVVVRLKPGIRAIAGGFELASAPGAAQTSGGVEMFPVGQSTVEATLARLRSDPAVAVAQPDYLYHASSATTTPNDPMYGQQWDMTAIDAPHAWTTRHDTTGVVVAVLDSGVDLTHPDLAANLWSNPNPGIGGCAPGTHGYNAIQGAPDACDPTDDNGHGTHVAGTIGAVGDNSPTPIGVAGVNWHTQLMPVKFLDHNGEGSDVDAWYAIQWIIAAKQAGVNVRVINASWGGPLDDPLLDGAIADAHQNNILFVAAAGNDGTNNDAIFQDPCNARYVLCVAASDHNDGLPIFSDYGARTVALAAPGVDITSTWPGNQYRSEQGTSMAAPHVSGAAALVLANFGNALSTEQLRSRLLAVRPVPALAGKVATGGVLDLCHALANCTTKPYPPVAVRALQTTTAATVSWTPGWTGNQTTQYWVTWTGPTTGNMSVGTATSLKVTGLRANGAYVFYVTPWNGDGAGGATALRSTPLAGGYVVDGYGGLHPFRTGVGPTPPNAHGGPYWPGFPIARGVALLPSGSGGYVLDGYGGLHPFAVGSNPAPPAAHVTGYWRGWDIARGVTMLADGAGGYVVDGYGGLHPFAVGSNPLPGNAHGTAYWGGWDIVRGLSTAPATNGLTTSGGYVLDAWGGLHPFSAGTGGPPPASAAPYWRGWDIARGVTITNDGRSGYIGDGWGGLHPFRLGANPPSVGLTFYRAGWDIARGPTL